MRLGTWNVLHGAIPPAPGGCGVETVDVARFVAAVADLDVDVLGLQEVDRDQPRSHGVDLAAAAAEAMGASEYRFVPTLVGAPGGWSPATGGEPAGTPAYGVALLSRFPVIAWRVVPLPPMPVDLPLLLGHPRRLVVVHDEPRSAVAARVATPHGPVTVVTTHLSFVQGWNLVQIRHMAQALRDEDPLVLTGDLNLGPRRARTASGLRVLAGAATYPAHEPSRQLDHLLGRGVVASAPCVHPSPVSDHRALSATVVPGP